MTTTTTTRRPLPAAVILTPAAEARVAKLTAIDFAALPLKDAIVWKQGTGARKLVV